MSKTQERSKQPCPMCGQLTHRIEGPWVRPDLDCPPPLRDHDYSRENLIAICEAAVVLVDKWSNRDTPEAQEKLGLAWVLLKAGCEFHVHPVRPGVLGCHTDENTIWLTIDWPSFATFEYGGRSHNDETFYLPTPKRLRERAGGDWY